MLHTLVLATRNKGKVIEFRRILDALAPGEINLIGVDEFPNLIDVEETGLTFEENALLKARYTAHTTGLPSISDDSGLSVDFLNGDPGIYSARWAGAHGNDQANLEKLLDQLIDVPDEMRAAHFTCVAALALPDGRTHVEEGLFHGRILREAVGDGGFGYDPIFSPLGMSISSAQMSAEEKDAISHRGKALRLIAPHVIQLLRSLG
ncbi:MAG: RdgB/HAM1 family non-canonical purine NTP pyrophosphatase [Actinobacteria bacterium]|uniref:dITP/XTP pyrophosphatase n=1 Tax=freshwater metagenome TaxID=449393 RepID=A0A6J5ZA42_9ZZZZ|nr:RdgB/HAM1 family non-canonical purine NTP pyrophosphatase [Actinomycetota bacterium]MSX71823.1 RdgB/HAM1 family non-canonical purine NTP pyrophosphatase [Actinomycetota bacterium]MSY69370.1 RdgB/HAM1 family non-canonical purine NTP pyrophosphatase [Actinomycetota bacterium]MTA76029.1 RdgB/HAM1 family non-canonical purine NTP pyrophosphatase [Actinomycetota bacterium]